MLASGPGATYVRLLDAGTVRGQRVALVAERPQSTGPQDSFEELLLIDLRDGSRTVFVRRTAWESGHEEARLLPGGEVAGLIGSEGGRTIVRWRPGTVPPLWTVPVEFDAPVDLAVRGNVIATVERRTARDGTTLPLLNVSSYDLATGRVLSTTRVSIVDPGTSVRKGLFCGEWMSSGELLCARRSGPPVSVRVADGYSRDLAGDRGAVATVARGWRAGERGKAVAVGTHVAFLRAVNLGRRTVRMTRLVELVSGLGHKDVWTCVNSGNVVFEAAGARAELERGLEVALEDDLGFEVTTFVRTAAELRRTLALEPFAVGPGDTYFVTFLKDLPSKAGAKALEALGNDFDTLVVRGRDVHWLMRGKSSDTTLKTKMWDDIVGRHRSTSRNTNMLRRLMEKIDARA